MKRKGHGLTVTAIIVLTVFIFASGCSITGSDIKDEFKKTIRDLKSEVGSLEKAQRDAKAAHEIEIEAHELQEKELQKEIEGLEKKLVDAGMGHAGTSGQLIEVKDENLRLAGENTKLVKDNTTLQGAVDEYEQQLLPEAAEILLRLVRYKGATEEEKIAAGEELIFREALLVFQTLYAGAGLSFPSIEEVGLSFDPVIIVIQNGELPDCLKSGSMTGDELADKEAVPSDTDPAGDDEE